MPRSDKLVVSSKEMKHYFKILGLDFEDGSVSYNRRQLGKLSSAMKKRYANMIKVVEMYLDEGCPPLPKYRKNK